MLQLIAEHSEILLSQEESGMGYQIVEATPFSDGKKICFVYNAELLVAFEELELLAKFASYDDLFSKESLNTSEGIKDLKVLTKSEFLKFAFSDKSQNPTSFPTLLLIQRTGDDEGFKRFSAYRDDRRITPGRRLREGTYATTVNDIDVVPSGLSAVARYALPHPWPAIYVRTITPPRDTEIQCGTVQPDFNQSGGGVEIFFGNGTLDNTVSEPYIIPER